VRRNKIMEEDVMTAAAQRGASSIAPVSTSGKLINIDNGGTLTDICVIDGDQVWRTKTLTTPYDLSECLFAGLKKASRAIYGKEDMLSLLLSTEYIRYSTTQGTNALVERKGPRLGVVLGGTLKAADLQGEAAEKDLFAALVGERVVSIAADVTGDALETAAVRAINALSAAGANRVIVAYGGATRDSGEVELKRVLLRKFPPHLLGAIPMLYSHEVAGDGNDVRRTWTAIFNAFLHPAMERFLYNAEHKLREFKTRNPLLIFRNDGQSARVAKTSAVKTYSSGPRGGAEGAKALAQHYGFNKLLSMDVGGTTTDIVVVENGVVRAEPRGHIQGVRTSFPLCDVVSVGVGGSSIIRAEGEAIVVGPQSVGSAPGPACFGLGGREATITDAFLVTGLLDPESYFGGELKIDLARARAAVAEKVGSPLNLDEVAAAEAMENAWVAKIAASLKRYTTITPDTVLAAFGGGGPLVACKVAEAAGISRIIIPGLAAVFSAFGIGFSDVGHQYQAPIENNEGGTDAAALKACRDLLWERARRGMYAEGADIDACRSECVLHVADGDEEQLIPLKGDVLPAGLPANAHLSLVLDVVKPIAHARLTGSFGGKTVPAESKGVRRTRIGAKWQELPVYRAEEQAVGATAAGPAILEEAFYTCRIESGWRLEINAADDILLTKI